KRAVRSRPIGAQEHFQAVAPDGRLSVDEGAIQLLDRLRGTEGLVGLECAGIDIITAEPVRCEVERGDAGRLILEEGWVFLVCAGVDRTAEIHRVAPAEVVALVVASRHVEIETAKSSGAVALEK